MLISRSAIMANGKNLGAATSAPCSWGKGVASEQDVSNSSAHAVYSFSGSLLDVGSATRHRCAKRQAPERA